MAWLVRLALPTSATMSSSTITCNPGNLAQPLALAQLIRVLLVCRHGPASFQVSVPPRFPGRSTTRLGGYYRLGGY